MAADHKDDEEKKWRDDLTLRMAKYVIQMTLCSICMSVKSFRGITVDPISPNCYTFRVRFPEGYPFAGVSISYRLYDGLHETLLFGANDKLIYIDKLGYEEHKVFKTVAEIFWEIRELYITASNPK